jgi:hypothetical protein
LVAKPVKGCFSNATNLVTMPSASIPLSPTFNEVIVAIHRSLNESLNPTSVPRRQPHGNLTKAKTTTQIPNKTAAQNTQKSKTLKAAKGLSTLRCPVWQAPVLALHL